MTDAGWWTQWWIWGAAALVLSILEVVLPGYIFLGFAIGAFFMSAIVVFGLMGLSMPLSLVVFAILSLAGYVALRRVFGLKSGSVRIWDKDINDN